MTPKSLLKPLPSMPLGVERRVYEGDTAQPVKPQLLTIALALLFADIVAVLLLQAGGLLFGRRVARAGVATLAALAIAAAALPHAFPPRRRPEHRAASRPRTDDGRAIQSTARSPSATSSPATGPRRGQPAGLVGLGRFLIERTAVEPGEPFGVNILNDEIAFFRFSTGRCWPTARPLPRVDADPRSTPNMKQGGMIVFRHQGLRPGHPDRTCRSRGEGGTPLQRLLGNLDIPRLEAVRAPRADQVVLPAALLPRRWDGGQLWVEAEVPRDSEQGRQARRVDE